MRFQTTPRFDRDWKTLKREHRDLFRQCLPAFNEACDAYAANPARYRWPRQLRVAPMRSVHGIFEMTWSFDSPDGRATFEFISDDAGLIVRWRRIGSHSIYGSP